jgi:EmrB/QacA subfamily drug resistance transporter
VLAATILGSSMAFLDGTVVNVALPAIQSSLSATAAGAQWIVEAYALLLAALLLAGGSLGDRYGRRLVFGAGVAIFTAASLWCGLAPSVAHLVAARAFQGVGGALMVPGSLALISASFPESKRGRAIGTWSGATAITTAGGPVLGGWLADAGLWRWVFFVNVPLAVAVLAILFRRVPESRDDESPDRLDWAGALLATIGLGGVVYALIASSDREASDALVWGTAATGIVALAAFVVVEWRSDAPMMPLGLFRSRTFTGTNLLTLLLYTALGGVFFFLPFDLIRVQGYSATAAGAATLPFVLILSGLSRWSGGLVERYGARRPLVAGPLVAAAGFALFAVPGADAGSYWTSFFPGMVVLGAGMALSVAPLTTAVMGAVETRHAGTASGINNAVSRIAALLAVAAMGALFLALYAGAVERRLSATSVSPETRLAIDAQGSGFGGVDLPASIGEEERRTARRVVDESFVAAFRAVMIAAALLAVGAAACSWLFVGGIHEDDRGGDG